MIKDCKLVLGKENINVQPVNVFIPTNISSKVTRLDDIPVACIFTMVGSTNIWYKTEYYSHWTGWECIWLLTGEKKNIKGLELVVPYDYEAKQSK